MKVFISWSGDRSNKLANALKEFLSGVFQSVKVWMSQDMDPGTRWSQQLNEELETSRFGVLCLTPENLNAPWLLFEAGSLAKSVSQSKVVPYCLGLKPADIPSPLAQFQVADADEIGTRRLVQSLNSTLESPLGDIQLMRTFDAWWPQLRSQIEVILTAVSPQNSAPSAGELERERQAVRRFCERVAGAWWERIAGEGIGFFQIRMDELHNSVRLEGSFYNVDGFFVADWYSVAARVLDDKKMIVYLRECSHSDRDRQIHGYGEMSFKGSAELSWGGGKFYDVDQAESTVLKPVELRRISDANEIKTMLDGTPTDRESLVAKTIDAWKRAGAS